MRVCPRCAELYPDDADRCPWDDTALRRVLDPLVGRTVGGRFRLIQRLGQGGMSSVYLARHVMIDRLMAIKTLRRDLACDPVQRDRFLREARAVNRINHPNIVEISDFGETDDGLVYLVMEYVPGDPLLRLLVNGPLAAQRALEIVEQCARALSRAHQMGVIHRDLKPENILIVPSKEGHDFVKLLDFGIAKILDAPSLTGSQQIFGTPGYIAPEYIQSTSIDGRADIYSLGCILYELVTGALPFDYEYPGDLLIKHVSDPPIAPSRRLASIDPEVEALILRCLQKQPEHRFRDAFELMTELRAVRDSLAKKESERLAEEINAVEKTRGTLPITQPIEASTEPVEAGAFADEPKTNQMPKLGTDAFERRLTQRVAPRTDALDRRLTQRVGPRLSIPLPPALDGAARPRLFDTVAELAEPSTARSLSGLKSSSGEGLLGARRWRQRFDAIRGYLDEIEGHRASPVQIAHAMAFAAHTLEDLEAAVESAQHYQDAVEALNEKARDFRGTLGVALDEAASALSGERGTFEALAEQRNALRVERERVRANVRNVGPTEGDADALLWKLAAVEEQLRSAGARCDTLESRTAELAHQIDGHNEELHRERAGLIRVLDAQMLRLEATANALRRPLERAEAYVREAWLEHDRRPNERP